jgi:hypothetical protein
MNKKKKDWYYWKKLKIKLKKIKNNLKKKKFEAEKLKNRKKN